MLLKLVPTLLMLNLSAPAFALERGEWHVVHVEFSMPLKLGTQRFEFGSSLIVQNARYFADGKSLSYVPSFSGFSKTVSQPSDYSFSECMLTSGLQYKETQTLADRITTFLGMKGKDVEYKGNPAQDTSIRVYKEFGVNDSAQENPLFDAYISVEDGQLHCVSRKAFTQATLDSIFAGSGVKITVLRPCRYDDVGNGVQKRVCE